MRHWHRRKTHFHEFRHQMKENSIKTPVHYFSLSTFHINSNYRTSGLGFEAREAVILNDNFKSNILVRPRKIIMKMPRRQF